MTLRKGIFLDGSITGLGCRTETRRGKTDAGGCFAYHEGETVTFLAGGLILGSGQGRPSMSPADLVAEVHRDPARISHCQVTNETRFLMSIGAFTPEVDAALEGCPRLNFVQEYDSFAADFIMMR